MVSMKIHVPRNHPHSARVTAGHWVEIDLSFFTGRQGLPILLHGIAGGSLAGKVASGASKRIV
jgi:hypothetical protein